MKLPTWLRQLLTEDDANSIICPVRVIGASGALTLFVATGVMVIAHHQFDALAFGGAVAAIAGAVGAGAGIKAKMGA
jgi:hypothetical protein